MEECWPIHNSETDCGAFSYTPPMRWKGRVTLTAAQAATKQGQQLIDLIVSMCHDGTLTIEEVRNMHEFLRATPTDIRAFALLRGLTFDVVNDGVVDAIEAYRLKLAFVRVVPKAARAVVETHLDGISLPASSSDEDEPTEDDSADKHNAGEERSADSFDHGAGDGRSEKRRRWSRNAAWRHEPMTQAQHDYILLLGGTPGDAMTKGEASDLIDSLLDCRGTTPRQVMILRFFNQLDLVSAGKDRVSEWIDTLFSENTAYELAWDRFKRETNHDPRGQDPSVVPIGAYVRYVHAEPATRETTAESWNHVAALQSPEEIAPKSVTLDGVRVPQSAATANQAATKRDRAVRQGKQRGLFRDNWGMWVVIVAVSLAMLAVLGGFLVARSP